MCSLSAVIVFIYLLDGEMFKLFSSYALPSRLQNKHIFQYKTLFCLFGSI